MCSVPACDARSSPPSRSEIEVRILSLGLLKDSQGAVLLCETQAWMLLATICGGERDPDTDSLFRIRHMKHPHHAFVFMRRSRGHISKCLFFWPVEADRQPSRLLYLVAITITYRYILQIYVDLSWQRMT